MSLRSKMLSVGVALVLVAAFASTATAGDETEQPEAKEAEKEKQKEPEKPRQAAEASAEVKAASGVEKGDPVEVSESFSSGDQVWIWSRVRGAKDTKVRHVWKRNGSQIAEVPLDIGSHNFRTWSRSGVSAGEYEVVVLAEDDKVLGEVSFTVE